MAPTPRAIACGVALTLLFGGLPLFASRRPDPQSSQNGQFGNCPANPENGPCPVLNPQGSATLTGTDASGNAVTVTISLFDWGKYVCSPTTCDPTPTITNAVLDVILTVNDPSGTDTAGVQSLAVKGALSSPSYLTCGGSVGVGCISSPAPDEEGDVQEPTPIAAADGTNTRWDFGWSPPTLPPNLFDEIVCENSGNSKDLVCPQPGTPTGEAVLVLSGSSASNNLGTGSGNYLVTLTDGTPLGQLVIPSPAGLAENNTQTTEVVITTPAYQDYTDTSLTYPQMNLDGSPSYSAGFVLAPVPPPSSGSLSCYPTNESTGEPDTRTFRTVWYTYTAPSDGSITIDTAGSRYDTLIYVFTGNVSTIACDDDPLSSGLLQAKTTFNATKDTVYQIVVYETPPFQAGAPGSQIGYPLSLDGTLYFSFQFTPNPPKGKVALGEQVDYFGQGTADFTVWRPSDGTFYSLDSSGKELVKAWGASTDTPVIGDYDGDGKTDFAVWRPSTGTWYILQSSNNKEVSRAWGMKGDIPVPGDYDGDGKTDFAVWRPSTGTWYFLQSSNGEEVRRAWGEEGDVPVPGDYDGDGKTDFAVWRPSTGTWYIIQSSDGEEITKQFGASTDVPVPADYDGDGKADIAVWRPSTGTFYIIQSSTGKEVVQRLGQKGDVPVSRDYDGDGKADFAVWQPSNGTWYVIQSSTGKTITKAFGESTDIPMNKPIGQ
jgi:hypothetical protein